jgi:hypothetical protein
MKKLPGFLIFTCLALTDCSQDDSASTIALFNGENLDNWVPKFTGFELGENYRDTFRVEDGLLSVSYENWPDFKGEFGHLFHEQVFGNYILQVEYRFVDEQVNQGPAWAFRNNGIMLHSQTPESMLVEQEFPASIEVQLLGGNGQDERSTANVCSPGTNYVLNGELFTPHCENSTSATFHGDQWVNLEIEVRGNELIRHTVNGEVVFEYSEPQLDTNDPDGSRLASQGVLVQISEGHIAIQAESHPTQFRRIDLIPLAP